MNLPQDLELPARLSEARRDADGFMSSDLALIFRHAQLGLGLYDRNLRFLHVNDRLAEINGIPAADHIGKTIRDVIPAHRRVANGRVAGAPGCNRQRRCW